MWYIYQKHIALKCTISTTKTLNLHNFYILYPNNAFFSGFESSFIFQYKNYIKLYYSNNNKKLVPSSLVLKFSMFAY